LFWWSRSSLLSLLVMLLVGVKLAAPVLPTLVFHLIPAWAASATVLLDLGQGATRVVVIRPGPEMPFAKHKDRSVAAPHQQ